MSRHIVITGNVVDGLFFKGPFDTPEAARSWAKAEFDGLPNQPWEIAPLASPITDEAVGDITKEFNSRRLPESALDDLVHSVASNLGSSANNGGIDDQARFLIEHLGFEDAFDAIHEIEPEEVV